VLRVTIILFEILAVAVLFYLTVEYLWSSLLSSEDFFSQSMAFPLLIHIWSCTKICCEK